MTYSEAKAMQSEIQSRVDTAAAALKAVPGVGSGNLGLTPDHVKQSFAYQVAKQNFDNAFAQLRDFNGKFVKFFAKEIKAERRARGR